ncbi:hypothetical protein B0H94_11829 [Salsuginibacillus halophilus]|uniref:YfbU-like protein n=1 Tax=Salsuginibacillus halophilus TaxID=517424 RepID=A0A2P8H671_9BACI|nr:YfbU family protein [Salsuginibacillus halophilus]PSL41716.1 hypothetical protein B0H94_11829 [Salsuginibacillus halophilus]
MEFSKKDRLFLKNQYEILSRLDGENSSNYQEKIEILEQGYEVHYEEYFDLEDDFPEESSRLVIDTLDLYSVLKSSYDSLTETNLSERDINFLGFDGNHETEHMVYTKFFVETLGRFTELQSEDRFRGYNSHMPMVSSYYNMVNKWKDELKQKRDLSEDEIKMILSAR